MKTLLGAIEVLAQDAKKQADASASMDEIGDIRHSDVLLKKIREVIGDDSAVLDGLVKLCDGWMLNIYAKQLIKKYNLWEEFGLANRKKDILDALKPYDH